EGDVVGGGALAGHGKGCVGGVAAGDPHDARGERRDGVQVGSVDRQSRQQLRGQVALERAGRRSVAVARGAAGADRDRLTRYGGEPRVDCGGEPGSAGLSRGEGTLVYAARGGDADGVLARLGISPAAYVRSICARSSPPSKRNTVATRPWPKARSTKWQTPRSPRPRAPTIPSPPSSGTSPGT